MDCRPGGLKPALITAFACLVLVVIFLFCFNKCLAGEDISSIPGWYPQVSGLGYGVEISSADADNAWALWTNGILHTRDAGNTWRCQYTAPEWKLRGISAADARTAWAVGEEGTILKTTDGGKTWNSNDPGTTSWLKSVSAVDSMTAWAVGEDGTILSTDNGGASWVSHNIGSRDFWEVSAVDASTAWVIGDTENIFQGCILLTTDGGRTWEDTSFGKVRGDVYSIAAVDASTLWGVGNDGNIVHTTDGGKTWDRKKL